MLYKRKKYAKILISSLFVALLLLASSPRVSAVDMPRCGNEDKGTHTSIDIGCRGQGDPITDFLFAIIRFLSLGVGLVIIASLIVAGIQYTSSRGDPQATAKAMTRVANTAGALLLYIFLFALINWVVPGAVLQ